MKLLKLASTLIALALSASANASIINTFYGVEYEWLELSATQGLSRSEVESRIASATPGDQLYGYQYASRELVHELFHSYMPWAGATTSGNTNQHAALYGANNFIQDFGHTGGDVYGIC